LPKFKIFMENKLNQIVLIPTDFSEVCQNAIDHGTEIAEFLNYKVCLLHVINKETKNQLKKENKGVDSIESKLKDLCTSISNKSKVKAEYKICEGSIFTEIHKVSSEIKANLVVLGTHGKTGLQHLFGSFALKVVTKSPIPVVVVQKRSFDEGYKKIIFPISDFTEDRQKVMIAIYIAKKFDSTINILKIHQSDPGISSKIEISKNQIEEVFKKYNIPYTIETSKKHQHFAKQVIDYSIAQNADLIMIMTEPDMYSPDFNISLWDEKLMFNESQIPVMCINPVQLGKIYYDYFSLM